MSHFSLIAKDIDVAPLLAELDAHPELWNERTERSAGNSPHREAQDIWVRYAAPEALRGADFMMRPHESVWWPAYEKLPSIGPIVLNVFIRAMGAAEYKMTDRNPFGGVLITRIPPGCQVYPHHDRGTWHSEHYDLKVWIPLRANDRCVNNVEGEEMVWKPGEAWSHDNLRVHSVRNEGDSERIVLILCFRRR